jgi:hypothetical protein
LLTWHLLLCWVLHVFPAAVGDSPMAAAAAQGSLPAVPSFKLIELFSA